MEAASFHPPAQDNWIMSSSTTNPHTHPSTVKFREKYRVSNWRLESHIPNPAPSERQGHLYKDRSDSEPAHCASSSEVQDRLSNIPSLLIIEFPKTQLQSTHSTYQKYFLKCQALSSVWLLFNIVLLSGAGNLTILHNYTQETETWRKWQDGGIIPKRKIKKKSQPEICLKQI